MGQSPTQVLDGMFLVDRFDLVEECINGVVQLGMHVEGQAGLGNLRSYATPLLELIGGWIGLEREHRVMQRLVDALSKKDIVDVTVTLRQLHPGNLLQGPVYLLRSTRHGTVDTKDADIEPALSLPFLKNLQHIAIATRNADRGEARSIHVVNQGPAAGLKLVRRYLGKSGGNGASSCDVTLDHARRYSASVAHNRTFDEVRRVGQVRFNPKSPQGPAVQKNLIVRLLKRDGIAVSYTHLTLPTIYSV